MKSTPSHFNRCRLIGEVAGLQRLVSGRVVGVMLRIHTGVETVIAVIPGRAPLPATLNEGDVVDCSGELGSEHLSRRACLMYLRADVLEILPPPFPGEAYSIPLAERAQSL